MSEQFINKNILITGGCGSVASEIISELIKFEPKVIRIFDTDEKGLYNLKMLNSKSTNIRYLIGNIRDKDRIDRATEDIDIIIHTAALKHVYFCEYNPFEAVKTNVQGTQNVIDAALSNSVEKMIFTSSDKAVNPTNVMGMTKLLAERLVVSANLYRGNRDTKFSCLRFGNILGSSGSVISLFRNQVYNGRPITITDKDMTRFIMSKKEATDFIISAIAKTHGGEIFIPKMDSIRIVDLAETMLELFGSVNTNKEIEYIGKIPGEKLYEELITESELDNTYENESMYIIFPEFDDLKNTQLNNYKKSRIDNININSKNAPHLCTLQIKSFIKKVYEAN